MQEKTETVEQDSWFRRNLYWGFFIGVYIFHGFISEWVSFPVYIGAAVLIYANVLYFISGNKTSNKAWFLANGWLKTNLFVLALMGGYYLLIFATLSAMTYVAGLVPESVAATFPFILALGLILYLIGLGFYLVEKANKI